MTRSKYVVLVLSIILSAACCWVTIPSSIGSTDRTVKVALFSKVTSLDAHDIRNIETHGIIMAVHRRLMVRSMEGQVQGDLAKSWTFSADGLLLTINLDDEAKFSNGIALVCSHVAQSLARIGSRSAYMNGSLTSNIESVECPDSGTVQLRMTEGDPDILVKLSHPGASVLLTDSSGAANHFVGSAGYFVSYYSPERIELKVNPFRRSFSKRPTRIVYQTVRSAEEAVQLFEQGNLDIVSIRGFLADPERDYLTSHFFRRRWQLALGNQLAGMSPEKRNCLFYIDRSQLIAKTQKAFLEETSTLHPDYSRTSQSKPFQKNIERKCRELAREPLGMVNILMIDNEGSRAMFPKLATELKKFNILARANYLPKEGFAKTLVSGNFGLSFYSFGLSQFRKENYEYVFSSSSRLFPGEKTRFRRARLALKSAVTASSETYYAEELERLNETNPLTVPLLFERSKYLVSKCLRFRDLNRILLGVLPLRELRYVDGCY